MLIIAQPCALYQAGVQNNKWKKKKVFISLNANVLETENTTSASFAPLVTTTVGKDPPDSSCEEAML